ncbi:hypothetical protein FRB95_009948 [Tulasnella sp. JGI-2019a]|nr:hypothetical protein FRB95_009948 [Tulasnella sp. JGI-2019a]
MSKPNPFTDTITLDTVTHDRLAKERITDTKLAEYDQITVVSQASLNRQMEHMHRLYKTLRRLDIRQIDDPNAGLINCALEPPQVKLRLGLNRQKVTYYIRIKSGTYLYHSVDANHTVTEHKHSVKGWVVALDVNMAMSEMDANKIPNKVKKKIENLGDYSVHQLQVDFTDASMAKCLDSESTIKLDQGERPRFDAFLNGYIEKLRESPESNILNLLPRVRNTNISLDAPTLVPTELNFQCIPFVTDKMDTQGKEGIKEGTANMLVYLQMTAHRPLPHDFLPISANWIIPPADNKSEAYDGTICLSKKIFLDGWLMPKMARFNDQSTWVTTAAEWTQSFFTFGFKLEGHAGISQADKDSDAQFNNTEWVYDSTTTSETIIANVTHAVPAIPAGSRVYKYSVNSKKVDATFPYNVCLNATTTNHLYIPEGLTNGKCAITITGQVWTHSYIHIAGVGELGVQQSWITATWATQLILDGVDQGHLKIRFEPATITPKLDVIKDESFLYPDFLNIQIARVRDDLTKMNMSGLVADLAKLFSGEWGFIFAGGRNFYIDKACFNREGDLLCQLNYKA